MAHINEYPEPHQLETQGWCQCELILCDIKGLLIMWILTCLIELFVRNIFSNNVRVTWDTVSCYININLGEKDLTLNFF